MISNIRSRWTMYPVTPTMSAGWSKSISSTFSSQSTTSCAGGVMPATVGIERFGKMQRLPRTGRI
jgi:hypothetical protein